MSNEEKVQVSAVVVTYNRLAFLKECIAALLQQTEKVAHIIVVDNHSAQETQDYLTSLGTKIDYLRLEQNIGGAGGFTVALNILLKKHKMILFG